MVFDPPRPSHPERNCWGCDQFCAASDLRCGNGSVRTLHPVELFGEGWHLDGPGPQDAPATTHADEPDPSIAA